MTELFSLPVEVILLALASVVFGLSSILLYRNTAARMSRMRALRRFVDRSAEVEVGTLRGFNRKEQGGEVNKALFRKPPFWMRFLWGKRTTRNLAMTQAQGLVTVLAVVPVAFGMSQVMPLILLDYEAGWLPMVPVAFLVVRKVTAMRANKRVDKIITEMPAFLFSIVRSTRLGTSFDAAFAEAVKNAKGPLKEEMGVAMRAMAVGQTASSAVRSIAVDLGMIELKMAAGALTAQENSGGSVTEPLENIANTIRTKTEIRKKIEAMAAQGFTSAIVLILAPLFIFMIIQGLEPDFYAEVYQAGATVWMLGICGVLMTIGYVIMSKIAQIEV